MKNISKAVRLSRRISEWNAAQRQSVYELEEIDNITEEVSKVFDDMKNEYSLSTDEVEKPEVFNSKEKAL